MLEIDEYEIRLVAGESVLIEFEIESRDWGNLEGDITGWFDIVDAPFNPCFYYHCWNYGKQKSIKLLKNDAGNFVLCMNSQDTKNLKMKNYWSLRLESGGNCVIPIINQPLVVRRLGYGKSQGVPCSNY